MTDREELIALIASGVGCPDDRDPFGEYCDSCRYADSADCSNERLADHLLANGVTVQGWIPVKDRLPEDGQSVLTCKNGICDIQIYEKRRNGWLCKGWFWSMATVTHWMPLPQPPKGE